MTLYEYRCKKCKAVFTRRRPMIDRNKVATCPCGGPGFRILSVPQEYRHVWKQKKHPDELYNTKEIWGK